MSLMIFQLNTKINKKSKFQSSLKKNISQYNIYISIKCRRHILQILIEKLRYLLQ